MQLVRDLLDQALRRRDGEPAGRVDDLLLSVEGDDIFVESILSGGGILADDLGLIGRGCEAAGSRRAAPRRCDAPGSPGPVSEPRRARRDRRRSPDGVTGGRGAACDSGALRHLPVRTADRDRPASSSTSASPTRLPQDAFACSVSSSAGAAATRLAGQPPATPASAHRPDGASCRRRRAIRRVPTRRPAGLRTDLPAAPNAVVSPPPARVPRAAG